ncbi:unnamed protein product [Albugo candida]|uniref:Uncharacterized protein n=1 Tax=Albugo candida TaxID=65357 RepID=A0A024FUA4_9STRA|nr:unnamed protein product [Albugo candida]|eukprot:CCI10710.1 unnamed protein product [Albugo candida]
MVVDYEEQVRTFLSASYREGHFWISTGRNIPLFLYLAYFRYTGYFFSRWIPSGTLSIGAGHRIPRIDCFRQNNVCIHQIADGLILAALNIVKFYYSNLKRILAQWPHREDL